MTCLDEVAICLNFVDTPVATHLRRLTRVKDYYCYFDVFVSFRNDLKIIVTICPGQGVELFKCIVGSASTAQRSIELSIIVGSL